PDSVEETKVLRRAEVELVDVLIPKAAGLIEDHVGSAVARRSTGRRVRRYLIDHDSRITLASRQTGPKREIPWKLVQPGDGALPLRTGEDIGERATAAARAIQP